MRDITICFVYFRSLTLEHLEEALYGVSKQDLSRVDSIIVLDNNTDDSITDILSVVNSLDWKVPVRFSSHKHGDKTKTHSWSTNQVVKEVQTPWVFFTRADYLLDPQCLSRFIAEREPEYFVTSLGTHLRVGISVCKVAGWRDSPQVLLNVGDTYDYGMIDTGVWLTRFSAFDNVGGLDEKLVAWGHAQTHFQWKLYKSGVEFKQISEPLFHHVQHGGEKSLGTAHQELAAIGMTPQELWERYQGTKVY